MLPQPRDERVPQDKPVLMDRLWWLFFGDESSRLISPLERPSVTAMLKAQSHDMNGKHKFPKELWERLQPEQ